MGEVILYIAASIDGYIADKEGGVEWMQLFSAGGQDYGYTEFYQSVGALVFGRDAYEQVLTFGPWPYQGKRTYVLTNLPLTPPKGADVIPVNGDLNSLIARARTETDGVIWLMGGAGGAADFLKAGLVDKIILSIVPVLLGDGIPLFLPGGASVAMTLEEVKRFKTGVVQLTYQGVRQM